MEADRNSLRQQDSGDRAGREVRRVEDADLGAACTFVGECSAVCPKDVDPAGAIQRYKLTAATQALKDFLLPRGAR